METAGEPRGRARALQALRSRDFRLLWSGQTISLVRDGAFPVALGWKSIYVLLALNDLCVIAMALTHSFGLACLFVGLRGPCIGYGIGICRRGALLAGRDPDRRIRALDDPLDSAAGFQEGSAGRMRSPEDILREAKTIALVGASPNPAKPSHGVMRYLLAQGYRVIPLRPADCDEVLGVPCVQTLADIDETLDLVDVFRRPEHTPEHAREAVEAGAKALWLQLGIVSPEARRIATEAGLDYVENLCTAVVHGRMERS